MSNDDGQSPPIPAITERDGTGVPLTGPEIWRLMTEQYRAALADVLRQDLGQCAPALGVHRLCEHDV